MKLNQKQLKALTDLFNAIEWTTAPYTEERTMAQLKDEYPFLYDLIKAKSKVLDAFDLITVEV